MAGSSLPEGLVGWDASVDNEGDGVREVELKLREENALSRSELEEVEAQNFM